MRSASIRTTSSSIPTSSPSPPASRSTTTTRSISSTPPAGSRRTCPARRSPAASPTFPSPSAATTRSARRCTPRFSITPAWPAWTWASSTPGMLEVYDEIPKDLLECVEDVLLNRRPDSTERLLELAESYKDVGGKKIEEDLSWRDEPVEKRLEHALLTRHRQIHRRGHRGGPPEIRPPAQGHRRPADGWHGRRRRPLRRRENVPAAGGEIRAGDEEGRRLADPVHGSGQGGIPRRRHRRGQGGESRAHRRRGAQARRTRPLGRAASSSPR